MSQEAIITLAKRVAHLENQLRQASSLEIPLPLEAGQGIIIVNQGEKGVLVVQLGAGLAFDNEGRIALAPDVLDAISSNQ